MTNLSIDFFNGGVPVVSVEDSVRVEHGDQFEHVFATQYSCPGIVLSATTRCIGNCFSFQIPAFTVSSSEQSLHLTADKEYFSLDQLTLTRVLT
jgi:hypothetical protein